MPDADAFNEAAADDVGEPAQMEPVSEKIEAAKASFEAAKASFEGEAAEPMPKKEREHLSETIREARWEPGSKMEREAGRVEKTLHNSTVSGAHDNVSDLLVVGNGDMFRLLCKASSLSEGWMKSTKALEVASGCLVQVTTQQRNPDGSYAVAEALAFIPGVRVVPDENDGRKLKR